MHCELMRQSLDLEIAKLIVESHIGLQEPGDGLLWWKCCPRRSGRGNTLAEPRGAAAMDNEGGRCSERESQGSD
jgi:hypothetical protein